MSPKEISEKIIKKDLALDNVHSDYIILARAYLELEKKLSLEQQDRESEKREFKVFKDAAENEITKLKEEKESIRTQLLAQCKMSHELMDEKEKLKKSREWLRKALEFYGDEKSWYDVNIGSGLGVLKAGITGYDTSGMYNVGGKKAREAIKADYELMKEGGE